MLTKIDEALGKNIGVGSVTVGGISVSYGSKTELLKLRDYYVSQVARENHKRPRSMSINIGGAFS